MGLTYVKVRIENPMNPDLGEDVELLVDTGAVLPWIKKGILEGIGVRPASKKLFKTIDGKSVERLTSFARIRYEEADTVVEIVMAEEGDVQVLGVVALESMGYRVNPVTKEIEYVGLLAVSSVGQ